MTTEAKGVSLLKAVRLEIGGEVWEKTNFGVCTEEKLADSYQSFTHDDLAELAILSGLSEFFSALAYGLGKRGIS